MGRKGLAKFLTKFIAALSIPPMLFSKGIGTFGTVIRCAMTLIILIVSLARGAVVLELKHDHHHDHEFHHSHHHQPGNGQSENGDDGDGEPAPERNTESHSHRLMLDGGPMMPSSASNPKFVPAGRSGAPAFLHEQCPDGPHLELIKPPQIN